MQTLKGLLDSPVDVFLGTLPLLLSLAWGLFSSERRLSRIETKLDQLDGKLATISECLVKVKTRIKGGHVVLTR